MIKIEKKHMSEEVLLYLRKQILLNNLKEGQHLKEVELSKQMNISRGPIREAILRLESEGLVETPQNGRTIVSKFDKTDIDNLYSTRILLEKHAISQITQEALKENLPVLTGLIDKLEEAYTDGIKDVEADLDFHGLLVKISGNKTLNQLWLSINGLTRTLIEVTSSMTEINQNNIITEHKKIIDYLLQGEYEPAQELLENHLKSVQLLVTRELE